MGDGAEVGGCGMDEGRQTRAGEARLVSYDLWTEPDTGLDWNYTYNISPMLARTSLRSLSRLDGVYGGLAAVALSSVLNEFDADPDLFRALNPKNGWGDFDGFRERLILLRDHLRANPEVRLKVG